MDKFSTKNFEYFPSRMLLTKDGEIIMRDGSDLKEYLKQAFIALSDGSQEYSIGVNICDNFDFNRAQTPVRDIEVAFNKSDVAQKAYADAMLKAREGAK